LRDKWRASLEKRDEEERKGDEDDEESGRRGIYIAVPNELQG
jgi:hypothetical protein